MAQLHKVAGYDEFLSFIGSLSTKYRGEEIYTYFTGSKDASGRSWCPDCNDAEPFLEKRIKSATTGGHFVYVDVGDRTIWKDPKNSFRTDRNTHLSVIPTLINWNEKTKRLEGDQLCKAELLDMFFEQD